MYRFVSLSWIWCQFNIWFHLKEYSDECAKCTVEMSREVAALRATVAGLEAKIDDLISRPGMSMYIYIYICKYTYIYIYIYIYTCTCTYT
jgi:hypothetical protein